MTSSSSRSRIQACCRRTNGWRLRSPSNRNCASSRKATSHLERMGMSPGGSDSYLRSVTWKARGRLLSSRGARPRFGQPTDVVVCLRVTTEQREKLQEAAARNQTTVADLLRDAVDSYVADFSDEPMFQARSSDQCHATQ